MPESNRSSPAPFRLPRGLVEWELGSASHVTHIENALAILRDGKVTARLVYDESILNTTRTHVVWLSPNDWSGAGGSRYGNIEFRFEWAGIASSGKAWWVGSMGYSPTAARILITERVPDASLGLVPYDPTSPGPWEQRAGRDIWNYEICLEVLAERDLPLSAVTELRCVGHHKMRCNLAPGGGCRDAGFIELRAAPILVAGLVSGAVPHHGLFSERDGTPTSLVETAWTALYNIPGRKAPDPSGAMLHTDAEAHSVARAVLGAVAARNDHDVATLCGLFRGRVDLREALAAVVEGHLGFPAGTLER